VPTLADHFQHAIKKYPPNQAAAHFCRRVAKKALPPNTYPSQVSSPRSLNRSSE
jgi:hypothetical protein